jgi:hypothetical protein
MQDIIFVVLKLKDAEGLAISQNTYWLAPNDDFTHLKDLKGTQLDMEIMEQSSNSTEQSWKIKVTNHSNQLAFFIRGQFMADGEELQPSFWSRNYFSLAPGDSIDITLNIPDYLADPEKSYIQMSGWNIMKTSFSLNK